MRLYLWFQQDLETQNARSQKICVVWESRLRRLLREKQSKGETFNRQDNLIDDGQAKLLNELVSNFGLRADLLNCHFFHEFSNKNFLYHYQLIGAFYYVHCFLCHWNFCQPTDFSYSIFISKFGLPLKYKNLWILNRWPQVLG